MKEGQGPMKRILKSSFLLFSLLVTPSVWAADGFDFSVLRSIPTLDQGRVKPFDTFARESVQTITGRAFFKGKDPVQTILGWVSFPEQAVHEPILLTRYEPLNRRVGIRPQNGHFSPDALVNLPDFKDYMKNLMIKQQEGETLNQMEKEAAQLFGRVELFHRILSGEAFILFPNPGSENWAGANSVLDSKSSELFKNLLAAYKDGDAKSFLAASLSLKEVLRENGTKVANYPSERKMGLEVIFNRVHPFQKAWILFLSAFLLALLSLGLSSRLLYRVGIALASLGVIVSIYGFISRCLIAGRPPVTNMYESVIWVSFGAMIFALIFEAVYRSRYFLLSGAAGATLGLILADNLPNSLSSNINPLVPVLRSNYWLTIHVLTITLSYAAFLLATGVAQVAVGFYAFKPQATEKIKSLNLFLYRVVQVGVVLLAAGTILGGVWANYSWGRFWGWDPKEVWALIALLGYLAILHGRYAGWLRDFGMAVWCVLAFLLVLMAWYGSISCAWGFILTVSPVVVLLV
jgi:ABC-type transport system involved in cytochrome c biogenesis permease subunit